MDLAALSVFILSAFCNRPILLWSSIKIYVYISVAKITVKDLLPFIGPVLVYIVFIYNERFNRIS